MLKRGKMGKKRYTQEQKEMAIARLTLGEKPTKIARDLKIPYGTVAYWKANLKKVKEQDGTLGYHFEKQKNFVEEAWKSVELSLKKIKAGLEIVELKSAKDIRDLVVVLGIFKDKIDKATPQPQLPAGRDRPLIDLSKASTAELEVIIARVKQIGKVIPQQLENGEVIEGESREIN